MRIKVCSLILIGVPIMNEGLRIAYLSGFGHRDSPIHRSLPSQRAAQLDPTARCLAGAFGPKPYTL